MKHVILLTSAHESPATSLVDLLRSAGIDALIEVLREEPPPEAQVLKHASDDVQGKDHPLAVLCEILPDANIEELRAAKHQAHDAWPGVPLVACRRPATEYERRHANIIAGPLLKRLGFRAIADDPAQLPALLRTLEEFGASGELLPSVRRADVDIESDEPPCLPDQLSSDVLRAAFEMVASLHFASDQKSAAQIALTGFTQIVPANRWTIYLTSETNGGDTSSLEPLASLGLTESERSMSEGDSLGVVKSDALLMAGADSQAARDAANRIEAISRVESGQHILAVAMVSGERVPGVVEAVREGSDARPFEKSEIDLVLALVAPVASAFVNSVRIAEAERLSHTDDLTKLYNARYLRHCVLNEVKRARRYNSSVTVLFLDLDDFKRVNDKYGHLVGSHVLMEMATVILSSVRDTDLVARYGGDEFVIVLPETGLEMAAGVAERIRSMIESNIFTGGRHLRLAITASFGVANFPAHAQSPQQLVAYADAAMYEAKADLKNCVRFAHPSPITVKDKPFAPTNADFATESQS